MLRGGDRNKGAAPDLRADQAGFLQFLEGFDHGEFVDPEFFGEVDDRGDALTVFQLPGLHRRADRVFDLLVEGVPPLGVSRSFQFIADIYDRIYYMSNLADTIPFPPLGRLSKND